ncbi:hypothetical protein [Vibrio harveyi]|uniref:hypothetical protein n=1 Tax=Vibrio harveyi TaxID=669 RepID=UPI00165D626B|nr:hypothetical protein [Vibrio harveyi]
MSYWFGSRVFDPAIDLEPCEPKVFGPYSSREQAKLKKSEDRLPDDTHQTEIFEASSEQEANKIIENLEFNQL